MSANATPLAHRRPTVPVVALFTLETLMMSVLGDDAVTDPSSHVLALAFLDGDVDRVWRDRIAPAISDGAIAFASPFRRTIPGTDTYTDAL